MKEVYVENTANYKTITLDVTYALKRKYIISYQNVRTSMHKMKYEDLALFIEVF